MQNLKAKLTMTRTARSLLLTITSMFLAAEVHADEVYKWVDSAGKTHFGDKQAAEGIKASKIDVAPTPSSQEESTPSDFSKADGGYSAMLQKCLAAGGTSEACVNKASIAQTNKMSNERKLEALKVAIAKVLANRANAAAQPPAPTTNNNSGILVTRTTVVSERRVHDAQEHHPQQQPHPHPLPTHVSPQSQHPSA